MENQYVKNAKKYNIIYCDPPWNYSKGVYQVWRPSHQGKDRELSDVYKTMSIKELESLPVQAISHKNCALFMWFTYSHLPQALELCKKWGFQYKTMAFVWVKLSNKGKLLSNIGAWTMGNTESCLIATKGRMLQHKKKNNIKQLVFPKTDLKLKGRQSHSKKPKEAKERIVELFGDLPRIELFARQKTKGWDVWGNEVKSDINLISSPAGEGSRRIMSKILIEYSSNNSGGDWWLEDKDWENLEKAGWLLDRGRDFIFDERGNHTYDKNGFPKFKKGKGEFADEDGRYMGALAHGAWKKFDSIKEALEEFEKITGQNVTDEGCSCCGPPHSFSWEGGYCSGDDCSEHFYGESGNKTKRELLEELKK